MRKTNLPPFMTFFDMTEIQSYGVLNREKQLKKHANICQKSCLFKENYFPLPQVRRKENILWRSGVDSLSSELLQSFWLLVAHHDDDDLSLLFWEPWRTPNLLRGVCVRGKYFPLTLTPLILSRNLTKLRS